MHFLDIIKARARGIILPIGKDGLAQEHSMFGL